MARIQVNNQIIEPFEICGGTRQEYPLSPLLFAIAIEPLAELIRRDMQVQGCQINDLVEKMSLYAYDMLLYLADSSDSLITTLLIITKLWSFSGFKVNRCRSSIIFIGLTIYTTLSPQNSPYNSSQISIPGSWDSIPFALLA